MYRHRSLVAVFLPALVCMVTGFVEAQEQGTAKNVLRESAGASGPVGSREILVAPLRQNFSSPVVTALAATPQGDLLAIAGDDHCIRLLEVATGDVIHQLVGHTDWIRSLVFSAGGDYLYSAGNDGRVLRWPRIDAPDTVEAIPKVVTQVPFAVRQISLATEKNLLAIAGFERQILVWDLENLTLAHRLSCDCEDQRCVRFSPDGKHMLCGSRDGSVHVWKVMDGSQLAHYHVHHDPVQTAAFSTSGNVITSVGHDRQLVQFDVASGKVRLQRELVPTKLTSMCMINDDVVAVAGSDNAVHLYDVPADQLVAELKGHFGTVAVMVACGNLLVSGSFDTTVRIWDLASIEAEQIKYGKPVTAPLNVDNRLRIR